MKFKNKFLVAALAITMTIGPSLTKDFSNLSIRSNVAYASEEPVEAKKSVTSKPDNEQSDVEKKEIDIDTLVPMLHEYLQDSLKDLQTYFTKDKLMGLDESIEAMNLTSSGDQKDQEMVDDLVYILTQEYKEKEDDSESFTLKEILKSESSYLAKDTDENNKLRDEATREANTIISEKIDIILEAMDLVVVETETETDKDNNEVTSKYLVKNIANDASNEAKKDYERKENRIVSYIKEKNMLASSGNQETEDLKNKINKILEAFKGIEDRSNYKYLPKEYKDLLINAKALVAKEDAKKTDLETMKKSLDEKSPKIMEFINKDELALRKEILTKNLDALEKKLNDNKSKISEEDFNAFNTFIKGVKEGMENEDVNKDILDQSIEEVGTKDKDLDEAIKNSGHSDQIDLKSYESAIAEAKSIKEKEDYKRSSEEARKAFDTALTNLENYIKDTSKFKKDEADNLKKALETATSKLDGKEYFNLLEQANKKLTDSEKKMSKESYDALVAKYNELNNKEKIYTVDDVKSFSKEINDKIRSATLKPSTSKPKNSGVQVSAKKVAVPRAQNGSRKSAKSLVRTGIDSIKIFGVVAVVAVVLLLLTKNKNKNGKNDNEK